MGLPELRRFLKILAGLVKFFLFGQFQMEKTPASPALKLKGILAAFAGVFLFLDSFEWNQ